MRQKQLILDSVKELHNVRSLTGASMLVALSTIFNRFTISFTATLRLSFGFLAVGMAGMLYGPVLTAFMGVAVDLLRFLVVGGPYFPGFTLSEFLTGFLYGMFLYRKPLTLRRVFLAKLAVTVLINLCLTPLWLSMLYGDAFIVLLSARILKNLIMLPIEAGLLYFCCKKVREFVPRRLVG